jgi:Ca2+-binding EF-hand superfamily protein
LCQGYINSEDLGSALAAVGYIVGANELTIVCDHLNIKPDMRLDFRLFTAVIAHQIMACSDTQIMDAFRMFDKEGRGTIGVYCFRSYDNILFLF